MLFGCLLSQGVAIVLNWLFRVPVLLHLASILAPLEFFQPACTDFLWLKAAGLFKLGGT
jgi:hypothetical protein